MARETFADMGVGSAAELAETQAVASQMAAARAARIAAEEDADDEEGGKRKAMHLRALELLDRHDMRPFHDPAGNAWLWVGNRLCCLSTRAGQRPLRAFLSEHGLDMVGTAMTNMIETLDARAAAQPVRQVFFRTANAGSADAPVIFVNLMDSDGRAVRIDGAGWTVVSAAGLEVELAPRDGGLPLPLPLRARDGVSLIDRLARHIPFVAVKDQNSPNDPGVRQRAVLLTILFAQFVRTGTVPHLALIGEQGGGKTTTARRINRLTDPDAAAVQSRLPADEATIFAQVGQINNFILDNSSGVRAEHADIFCVLATGAAHSARRLYTNSERSISRALATVIFTSVLDGGLTKRPDLLDRMLPLAVTPLPKDRRRSENELNEAWEADLSHLLAGLFDLLAVGAANVAAVRAVQRLGALPPPPRFADVAQMAEAAAWHGLGWPAGLLTRALNALRADAAQDQLADDPIAFRLRAFLQSLPSGVWSGNYAELDRALAFVDGPVWDRRISLRGGLPRIKGQLRDLWGIEVTDGPSTAAALSAVWCRKARPPRSRRQIRIIPRIFGSGDKGG